MTPSMAPDAAELRQALRNASTGTAGSRLTVMRAFLQADIIVPLVSLSGTDRPARVATAEDRSGQEVLPVFTRLEELGRWIGRDVNFGGLPARQAAQFARERRLAGIVIDPGSDNALALASAEVDLLADGILPSGEGSCRVFENRHVHEPTKPIPEPVLDVAKDLATHREVASVYIYEARYGEDKPVPRVLTLGIRVDSMTLDRRQDIMREIVKRVSSKLPAGLAVDVAAVDEALEADLVRVVRPILS